MMNETPANRELRSLFSEHFHCAPADFEKRVFWKCLYGHAKILAPLLGLINPGLFERDRHFIHCLGNAKDWKDVKSEISALRYEDRFHPKFLRNALRIRISRRKSRQLAAVLFPQRNAAQQLTAPAWRSKETAQKSGATLPESALFDLRSKEHP